jgi:hypothetical protein
MVEQYISNQTAQLAKQKGFDCKVSHCYDERGMLGHVLMSKHEWYQNTKDDNWNVAAPTQSVLQKWLREVHNIHIEYKWKADETYQHEFRVVDGDTTIEGISEIYHSYEGGLEESLEEALKLIS